MGNIFCSHEDIEQQKRMNDFEKRILELEQRVFLGMTRDEKGQLVFEKDIDSDYARNTLKQSLLTNPNKPGAQEPTSLFSLLWGNQDPVDNGIATTPSTK
uniref:Uncharacterized protein n=1 Tax=viral metagenome TaxID=1070528 RepID=A0A6C0F9T7_9ZZZZ|tara:strand:+ start:15380 stop:15679 length:300 start_codon:yes stop_codon:yes gene_type:complete